MLAKIAFVLAVVCFTQTMTQERGYGRRRGGITMPGGGGLPGGIPMPGGGGVPGGIPMPGGGGLPGGIPLPGGGDVLGGVGQCIPIEGIHEQFANFAVRQLGKEYNLVQILGVRTQVVQGVVYHMELYVSKTVGAMVTCEHCDVKVQHIVWLGETHFRDSTCRATCCR